MHSYLRIVLRQNTFFSLDYCIYLMNMSVVNHERSYTCIKICTYIIIYENYRVMKEL